MATAATAFACCTLACVATPARAQSAAPEGQTRLAPVVVTATRTEESPFQVPASIDRIGGDTIRDAKAQVNISESLGGVPGLLARDRQNYAQDVQISVRGFGARSTFGIRGVRLYVDDIPATLPDGQGQITNVDLGSADRIEVLRGPFSALYGNSSGGVIQVFTEDGTGPPSLGAALSGGSYGALRVGAKASGAVGAFGYVVSGSNFHTDGYRDHSAAERNIGNAKLTWRDDANRVTLVVNSLALPKAQDPLGLTRAQFDTDPRSVDPAASSDTRKTVDQVRSARPGSAASMTSTCALARLRRAPEHGSVPGDPGRTAGEPAPSGRRHRPRARLQRRRPALDRADAPRRRAVHARRRCLLRRAR